MILRDRFSTGEVFPTRSGPYTPPYTTYLTLHANSTTTQNSTDSRVYHWGSDYVSSLFLLDVMQMGRYSTAPKAYPPLS